VSERPRILLVGSPSSVLPEVMNLAVGKEIDAHFSESYVEGLKTLGAEAFDVVVAQARLDETSGLTLIRRARSLHPTLHLLLVGPPVSSNRKSDILAAGADDYLVLPMTADDVLNYVVQTLSARRMAAETDMLGRSPKMLQVFETIRQVAPTKITVLIVGASGTGKEVAAHAIHNLSQRKTGPFIAVNCGAIPEGLLESELFGHERGAFTGAQQRHRGRFEQADGGTLFLDEIGETPLNIQVKLLRALEEQIYYRVGGQEPIRSDVRLIAATNRNLEDAVAQGSFRRDLYFRLRVVTLVLPTLRERTEDIPLLVDHFLAEAAARHGSSHKSITPEAIELLKEGSWPGNVRELKNVIESLSVLVRDPRITAEDVAPHLTHHAEVLQNLPVSVRGAKEDVERELIYRTLMSVRSELADLKSILLDALRGIPVEPGEVDSEPASGPTLSETETRMITEALRQTQGNRKEAAEMLGISERTLYRRLRQQRMMDEKPENGP